MVRVAPIKLQYNPRTLWFDPQDLEIDKDTAVVVKTARGIEFGHAASDIIEVEDAEIKKLKTELKPVMRLATPEDEAKAAQMQIKSDEALPIFKEMAAESSPDMHPVSVEYLLDGDKAVFFFESEERVDFRDLVRKIASHFHIRVDMRQIGVRDEARMVGGYGHCGQELCCKRLGGEFCPVSIRMAKEQDLSLNPQKISGVCGRLMCCLRYEFDAYKEFKSRAPKQNSMVETPEGCAKVVDLDMPREQVAIRVDGGKTVKFPLGEMETSEKATRPDTIPADVFEAYTNTDVLDVLAEPSIMTPHFTGEDKLADPQARPSKNSKGRGGSSNARSKSEQQPATESRKPRRRRTTVGTENQEATTDEAKKQGQSPQKRRSSGRKKQGAQPGQQNTSQSQGQGQKQGQGQGSGQGGGRGQGQGSGKKSGQRQGDAKPAQKQGSGPRPGQKSSGLRSGDAPQSDGSAPQNRNQPQGGEATHRKARRRTHKAGGEESSQSQGGGSE